MKIRSLWSFRLYRSSFIINILLSISWRLLPKKKPIFLEFLTYRKYEHVGHLKDDHLNYRPKSEINFWKKRDPLISIAKFLSKKKVNKSLIDKINLQVKSKIKKAFIFAEKSKFPNPEDYKLHVYK